MSVRTVPSGSLLAPGKKEEGTGTSSLTKKANENRPRWHMGLHAFRNIGFYFKDQGVKATQWQDKFRNFDSSHAASVLKLPVKNQTIEVKYFDCLYRLRCTDGVVERWDNTGWTDNLYMNEALVIYHLFGDMKEFPVLSGQWCPEDTLDPVRMRSGNRMDPLFKKFADLYDKDKGGICEKALAIGGKEIDQGDCGFEFYPFDFLGIRTVFWDADEDFPAQMKVYVDTHITDYMDYEAVDFVIADLLMKLQPET